MSDRPDPMEKLAALHRDILKREAREGRKPTLARGMELAGKLRDAFDSGAMALPANRRQRRRMISKGLDNG